jgi:hypothetical protein
VRERSNTVDLPSESPHATSRHRNSYIQSVPPTLDLPFSLFTSQIYFPLPLSSFHQPFKTSPHSSSSLCLQPTFVPTNQHFIQQALTNINTRSNKMPGITWDGKDPICTVSRLNDTDFVTQLRLIARSCSNSSRTLTSPPTSTGTVLLPS